jgi:hypothetical protein
MIIPPLTSDIVGINITPRTLTCSWIKATPKKETPYELKAYKHLLFDIYQKTSLVLFNPTRLRSLISTFLKLHNLSNAYIVFSLSGKEMIEKQRMLLQPAAELKSLENDSNLLWHYYCLQENTQKAAPWYCCAFSHELLFQYQLFAIHCRLNLIQITTPTMALLQAYSFLKDQKTKTNMTNITELINLNGHIRVRSPQEHAAIVESFGLFLLGQQLHEEH